MNTITRQAATAVQLVEIEGFIHAFMDTLGVCLEETDFAGLSVEENIKMILGFGVKSGALGKFENLDITDKQITFYVWIKVNFDNPSLYYKLKTTIFLDTKRVTIEDV